MNRIVRRYLLAAIVAGLALGFRAPAWAGDPNDDGCVNETNLDLKIGYCTSVIQSGRYTGANAAWAFYNRGNTYGDKGQYGQALQDLDEAIHLKPDYASAYNNRCWYRTSVGKTAQAIADCNKAIQLKPTATRFDTRGWANLRAGNSPSAASDFNAALKLDAKFASSLYGRSLLERQGGDLNHADRDLAAAKAIQSDIEAYMAQQHIWPP